MECAFAYMPEVDTDGLLRDSEHQLMASAKVVSIPQQSLIMPRLLTIGAAQTEEEQADARDIIAQVHDPAPAAVDTAAAAAAPSQSAAAGRK
jgi:hypothetical protein